MMPLFASADSLLRGRLEPDVLSGTSAGRALLHLLLLIGVFGLFYGAVMGTFGGIHGDRWLQLVYSGVKVPIGKGRKVVFLRENGSVAEVVDLESRATR